MKLQTITILTLILFLSSCATTINPKDLSQYSSLEKFVIDENIEYVEERGLAKVKWAESLKKGEYFPMFQDESGYYFLGPELAVTQKMGSNPNWDKVFDGGIWKSKKDPDQMKVFYFLTYDPKPAKQAGEGFGGTAIYTALTKAEANKYHFLVPNQQLLDRLKAAYIIEK